jgi:hypothetical protein
LNYAKQQQDLYTWAPESPTVIDPKSGKVLIPYKPARPVGPFIGAPPNLTLAVTEALISPGKPSVAQAVAGMTSDAMNALIAKVDAIYQNVANQEIANMIAEEIRSIITLVRIIAQAAQGSSSFAGILASGQELDVWPLRPKDVGGVFLNGNGTATKGLYGGTSAGVYSWVQNGLVGGTAAHLIPTQTTSGQSPFGGLIIFGGIERVYSPKIRGINLILQGQPAGTVPPQPITPSYKKTFGDDSDISFFRLEKPVIITQNENFGVDIMPDDNGTTNFELIALMVGQVQSKTI